MPNFRFFKFKIDWNPLTFCTSTLTPNPHCTIRKEGKWKHSDTVSQLWKLWVTAVIPRMTTTEKLSWPASGQKSNHVLSAALRTQGLVCIPSTGLWGYGYDSRWRRRETPFCSLLSGIAHRGLEVKEAGAMSCYWTSFKLAKFCRPLWGFWWQKGRIIFSLASVSEYS